MRFKGQKEDRSHGVAHTQFLPVIHSTLFSPGSSFLSACAQACTWGALDCLWPSFLYWVKTVGSILQGFLYFWHFFKVTSSVNKKRVISYPRASRTGCYLDSSWPFIFSYKFRISLSSSTKKTCWETDSQTQKTNQRVCYQRGNGEGEGYIRTLGLTDTYYYI